MSEMEIMSYAMPCACRLASWPVSYACKNRIQHVLSYPRMIVPLAGLVLTLNLSQ